MINFSIFDNTICNHVLSDEENAGNLSDIAFPRPYLYSREMRKGYCEVGKGKEII
jgi:hypothetical protein